MLLYIYIILYTSLQVLLGILRHIQPFFLGRSNWMDCVVGKAKKEFRKNGNPSGSQSLRLWYCGWCLNSSCLLHSTKKTHTKCIKDVRNYQPSIWATSPATKEKQGRQRDSVTPASHLQPMASLRPNVLPLWLVPQPLAGQQREFLLDLHIRFQIPQRWQPQDFFLVQSKERWKKWRIFWIHGFFGETFGKIRCVWCLDGMTQKNPAKSEKRLEQVIYDYCTLRTSTSQPTFHGSPFSTRQDQATGEAVLVQFVESMSCHCGRSGIRN